MRRFKPYKNLLSGGSAHFIHDAFTDGIFVLLPIWAQLFGLSPLQVGVIKSVASSCMAVFQIPCTLLAERLGRRFMLVLGTLLASAGYLLLSGSFSFGSLVVAVALMGLGCASQHPLASALVSESAPLNQTRSHLGIYNFTGDLGKVVAPLFLTVIAAALGWRYASFSLAIIGVVIAVSLYFLLGKEKPTTVASQNGRKSWGIVDVSGFVQLSCIAAIDNSARAGFLTFMPFVLIAKQADISDLGLAMALTLGGGALGKLLCGFIADRFGVIGTVVITELATAFGIVLLLSVDLSLAFWLLPLIGLVLNGTSSVLYGSVADFVENQAQSRAFSLFYTVGIGASALAPFAYGVVSDSEGVNSALSYIAASLLLILPFCWFLARHLTPEARTKIAAP